MRNRTIQSPTRTIRCSWSFDVDETTCAEEARAIQPEIELRTDAARRAALALKRVRAPGGRGLYASASRRYGGGIFGRDSAESAEDILHIFPEIAREVIFTLAYFQGTQMSGTGPGTNEEEPGKIHHEYRDVRTSPALRGLIEELSGKWGGDGQSFLYYGSVDATPLFVRLVGRYCRRYGSQILDADLVNKDGNRITVRQSAAAATRWVADGVRRSDLSLLEFRRRNPLGHRYQTWKDSRTAYVHPDRSLGNFYRPIAAIEVQGLAYDALVEGAALLNDPSLRALASELAEATIRTLWMDDHGFFGMAVDRDESGNARVMRTRSSGAGALMDSEMFRDMPDEMRQKYVGAIVQKIWSPQFLSDAGIRCRSSDHAQLAGYLDADGELTVFQDYHGSWAVWVKETYDVAKGLRRQQFPLLAEQLRTRIHNAVAAAGTYAEFFWVNENGAVQYDIAAAGDDHSVPVIPGEAVADGEQTWTIAAVLGVETDAGADAAVPVHRARWAEELEAALLDGMPTVARIEDPASIAHVRAGGWRVRVDPQLARAIEDRVILANAPAPNGDDRHEYIDDAIRF